MPPIPAVVSVSRKLASQPPATVLRDAGGVGPVAADSLVRRCIGLFVIMGGAVSVYAMRQADPDFFGYLAYGRLFVERGGPVAVDPFAYTSVGGHWVAFEYLSQALLWQAYSHFGPIGLIALKMLVGGATLLLVYAAVRTTTDDPFVWGPACLLSVVTLSRFFLLRPQLFTFLFFSLFVLTAFRFMVRGSAALWPLPFVTLLWANMHGGFVAGFGALGLAIVIILLRSVNEGQTPRAAVRSSTRLILTLGACVLASMINPHGTHLWRYVITELTHSTNRSHVVEWMPMSWARDPWSATALTVLTASMAALAALAPKRSRIIGLYPWQWLLVSAPVLALAFLTARNVTIAAIWCAPVLALLRSAAGVASASRRRVWLSVTGSALVGVFLTAGVVWFRPRPEILTAGPAVLGTRNPCRAARFMRENLLTGNLYTPLWWGSYLSWQLYPAIRVSMDGRNISVFPDELVAENFAFYGPTPHLRELQAPLRYQTDFLLIPSDSPILRRVQHDTRWRALYGDSDTALFVRVDRDPARVASAVDTNSFIGPPSSCSGFLEAPRTNSTSSGTHGERTQP